MQIDQVYYFLWFWSNKGKQNTKRKKPNILYYFSRNSKTPQVIKGENWDGLAKVVINSNTIARFLWVMEYNPSSYIIIFIRMFSFWLRNPNVNILMKTTSNLYFKKGTAFICSFIHKSKNIKYKILIRMEWNASSILEYEACMSNHHH